MNALDTLRRRVRLLHVEEVVVLCAPTQHEALTRASVGVDWRLRFVPDWRLRRGTALVAHPVSAEEVAR